MFKSYFPYYKRLIKLALPLILTQMGQSVVQLVDNAMVGHVGTTELAAASFANSVFFLVLVFAIGITVGITPILGKSFGAGDERESAEIVKNGLLLSSVFAVVITLLAWLVSYAMPYLGQPIDVIALAIPYYKILVVSLIPLVLFLALKQIGEGLENTMLAMIATLTANVVNVGLNYILIYGKMGAPALGLNGAGYATLISRFIMVGVIYICFSRASKYNKYFKLLSTVKISYKKVVEIAKIGFPIGIQMISEGAIFTIAAIMMGWIGDVALAAHQVAFGLITLTYMVASSLSMATTIRVSIQYGDGNIVGMKNASKASIHIVLVFMGFCGVWYLLARNVLPVIFTTDALVIQQAASLLIVASLFQLVDGVQAVCLSILRGISDVKMPMAIAAVAYLLIGLPVSYLLAFTFNLGAEGIWYGFVVGLGCAAIMLALRIKYRWKRL